MATKLPAGFFRMVLTGLLLSFMVFAFTRVALANSFTLPHHDIDVTLLPENGEIRASDRITLPGAAVTSSEFLLNGDLDVEVSNGVLHRVSDIPQSGLKKYRVQFKRPVRTFTISYHGSIRQQESGRMDSMPVALIDTTGVYLDGASAWYPVFGQGIGGFILDVESTADWEVISQGKREKLTDSTRWTTTSPQDEIYLLAGPFKRYVRDHHGIDLSVYLLDEGPALAEQYLAVMGDQIDLYSRLIGEYPYRKFAVVENRWQTGYGMPSFTLLGSRVIRLPFIPYTSLPHEILHNWWGNGVWVDYQRGNWSEGLTAYLADHLMKELKGKGADYRRKALERYASFAAEHHDFPLIEFRARHDEASQAVGYSKSLMLFHMLRRELGDADFRQALQDFWRDWQFRQAGFMDVLDSFSRSAGRSLDRYEAFLTRTGAPALKLANTRVEKNDNGYRLSLSIEQTQAGPLFRFDLPVTVMLDGEPTARILKVTVQGRSTHQQWDFPTRPLRVDVDPAFDVFRLLDDRERPPTLGQLFGAQRQWMVLPTQVSQAERQAWQELAEAWQQRYDNINLIDDSESETTLPPDAPAWLLGWNNAWLPKFRASFSGDGQRLLKGRASINEHAYTADTNSVVLMSTLPDRKLAYIGASGADAIAALARKLPHYSSYGRLVFDGKTDANLLKESLTAAASPLSTKFTETAPVLKLPVRTRTLVE